MNDERLLGQNSIDWKKKNYPGQGFWLHIIKRDSPRSSSLAANKKGYFYFIEIALIAMLLITFFYAFSPKAEISYLSMQDINNLKQTGYGTLKFLDDKNVFSTYIDPAVMANSDFAKLKMYIEAGLPSTVDSQIEYAQSSTVCYSEAGVSGGCGLAMNGTKADVVRADYTYSKRPSPITIHLFLWRTL